MRFADQKWEYDFEPNYDTCVAAAYLEAKGLVFLNDFNVQNALVKAEARMQLEAMDIKGQG